MSSGTKSAASKVTGEVPYLEQTAGNGWGRTFELSRNKLSIGRTTDNEIVLDSTSVSRVHAILRETPKGWFIEDNISKNGIWINGIAIKKALLRPGDLVQIGEFVFRYCEPKPLAAVVKPAVEEAPKEAAGQKTEILSTDTWNVGVDPVAQKPPVEMNTAAPTSPIYTSPPPSPSRPRVIPPAQPIHLASFGKTHQEKLYLALGLLGGLLVGGLLYMRTQRPAPSVAKNRATEWATPMSQEEAFRQIAENAAEEEDGGLSDYVEKERQTVRARTEKKSAPAHVPTPMTPSQTTPAPSSSAAQVIQQAEEQSKQVKIRPEELQMGIRSKKNRAASKDISLYLDEGKAYLRDGDFESASLAYRFALVIDPHNAAAKAGLASAQQRKKSGPEDLVKAVKESRPIPKPAGKDKNAERKASVHKLLRAAAESLKKRRYQEAIGLAEKARQIELPGETAYLNEAKQIIDRSGQRQKEEFEPFIALARKKLAEGDFRGSILLCEEMLRTDPGYAPARECMDRSTAGIASSTKKGDTK